MLSHLLYNTTIILRHASNLQGMRKAPVPFFFICWFMLYNAEWKHGPSLHRTTLTWPVFTSLPQPQLRDTTQSRGHGDTGWSLHDQKSYDVLSQIASGLQNPQLVFGYLFVQNDSSAQTTSACAMQDLNFCLFVFRLFSVGCSFFYSTVFTPALPACIRMLTIAPPLWIILTLFCL